MSVVQLSSILVIMSAPGIFPGLLLFSSARSQYSVTRTNPLSPLSSKLTIKLVRASQGQMLSLQCPLNSKVSYEHDACIL